MSKAWFIIGEAFSGLRHARLSASFSILMVALSFTLLGTFYITSMEARRFLDYLRNKVEIEVFLSDSLSSQQMGQIREEILGTNGVSGVQFISKDDAANIFKKEFGQDIESVLGFNPLPASYRVFLKNDYKNTRGVSEIAASIGKMPGVESVKYRKFLLTLIDRRVRMLYEIMSAFGGALVLLSIFLVYNSMRIAISYKRQIIDTMKLVGASKTFVRMPFLVGGMIQGFAGGIAAAAVIYGVVNAVVVYAREDILARALPQPAFYAAVVGIATLLGLLSTLFATRRYIKESLS